DAGHGGHDPGAHGNGINEAELTLDVALRLQKLLDKAGVDVVMTRDSDLGKADAQPARHREGDRTEQQDQRVARPRRDGSESDGEAPRPEEPFAQGPRR